MYMCVTVNSQTSEYYMYILSARQEWTMSTVTILTTLVCLTSVQGRWVDTSREGEDQTLHGWEEVSSFCYRLVPVRFMYLLFSSTIPWPYPSPFLPCNPCVGVYSCVCVKVWHVHITVIIVSPLSPGEVERSRLVVSTNQCMLCMQSYRPTVLCMEKSCTYSIYLWTLTFIPWEWGGVGQDHVHCYFTWHNAKFPTAFSVGSPPWTIFG